MGSLRELSNNARTVHLVQSNSGIVDIFVYDELKACHQCDLDSVYTIDTKADFSEMLSLVNVQPYTALRWLFQINLNRSTKPLCIKHKGIFSSDSSCFLIKSKRYADYKEVKEVLPQCNDLYLSLIRRRDVAYLFKDLGLTSKLLEFVSGSYCKEPEKILELRRHLLEGEEVKTQKDIVKLIGSSTGAVNSLVFLLLADPPVSKSGLSRVLKKRMQMLASLSDIYGISDLRRYMNSITVDLLELKQLYNQGVVYDRVKDIPECYDEERLSKYSYCLQRIWGIPYMRILKLSNLLSKRWYSLEDSISFLYQFYSDVTIKEGSEGD